MLCTPMSASSSPTQTFPIRRRSSPLNPYAGRSSSPPMASSSSSAMAHHTSSPTQHRTKTRYKRPEQTKYLASAPTELFAENTTPIEGQMWRGQFRRRAEERQRRKNSREAEVDRRRGNTSMGMGIDEGEDEAKARAEDEEIFRRLVVHQRHRAQAMFEDETGGSDHESPDFWDDSPSPSIEDQRAAIEQFLEEEERNGLDTASSFQTPTRPSHRYHRPTLLHPVTEDAGEEELWAMEAAQAEEAERAAEEEARHAMELEQQNSQRQAQELLDGMEGMDIDMDWDMDSD